MPPAATEDTMAGVSKTSFRRGVRNEKRSLNDGAGGGGGGMSRTYVVGEEGTSCCLISIEESVDVRRNGSGSARGDGSWLFIAVADDDEQLIALLWIDGREGGGIMGAFHGLWLYFCSVWNGQARYCLALHCPTPRAKTIRYYIR